MPAICKAQTTKQAKASFKARGRPSLSDKEQRQLERSIELEDRAERAKEAERRRTEAAKKRLENEEKDRAVRDRNQLLSQRRCDKFGFKASQFHLGAFFGKNRVSDAVIQADTSFQQDEDDDAFEDDDLDDEELLRALEMPRSKLQQPKMDQDSKSDAALMPPPPRPPVAPPKPADTGPDLTVDHDLSGFWDELESSTQIARDLSSASPGRQRPLDSKSNSFSSGDFDLTAEDLDELDPPKPATPPAVKATKTMLPPALPVKPAARPMPPPPAPTKRVLNKVKPQNAIRGPFLPASSLYCSPELGFTLTQLESFVDDDLQLTQAVPG